MPQADHFGISKWYSFQKRAATTSKSESKSKWFRTTLQNRKGHQQTFGGIWKEKKSQPWVLVSKNLLLTILPPSVAISGRGVTATLRSYPHLMLPPLHSLPAKHKINFSTRKTRITHQLRYRTDLRTLTSSWKIIGDYETRFHTLRMLTSSWSLKTHWRNHWVSSKSAPPTTTMWGSACTGCTLAAASLLPLYFECRCEHHSRWHRRALGPRRNAAPASLPCILGSGVRTGSKPCKFHTVSD